MNKKWAESISLLAAKIIDKITPQLTHGNTAFNDLLTRLRDGLGDRIKESDAVELVCQYIITKPIFESVFPDMRINNALNQSIELTASQLNVDLSDIDGFYRDVEKKAKEIHDNAERQSFITDLYEKFFKAAFPRMSKGFGIVYTPIEVVDFILNSVDQALRNEFGVGIGDSSVDATDPFTGTGIFISRLIESDLISDEDLQRKYKNEIHANEIVPLAYMLAGINIQNSYYDRTGEFEPFPGLELMDTFLT